MLNKTLWSYRDNSIFLNRPLFFLIVAVSKHHYLDLFALPELYGRIVQATVMLIAIRNQINRFHVKRIYYWYFVVVSKQKEGKVLGMVKQKRGQ